MRELRYKLIPHFNPNLASNCLKHVLQKPTPLMIISMNKAPPTYLESTEICCSAPCSGSTNGSSFCVTDRRVAASCSRNWLMSVSEGRDIPNTDTSLTNRPLVKHHICEKYKQISQQFYDKDYSQILKQWYALYVLLHSYKEHESCRWYEMYSNFFNSLWSNSVINLGQHWFR